MKPITSILLTIPSERLQELIDTSNSYLDILRKLGIHSHGGGNMRTLHKRLTSEKFNLEKLNTNRSSSYALWANANRILIKLDDILVENSTYQSTSSLRKRLIKENVLKNECIECGQLPLHNNKPLTLQLDHINGVNNDHRIENLRILCPNCHTQTETYGRKGNRFIPRKLICIMCESPISRGNKSGRCIKCTNASRIGNNTQLFKRSLIKPSKELLELDLAQLPMLQIGVKYGVSDNAVRKWLRSYNLPFKKQDIQNWIQTQ